MSDCEPEVIPNALDELEPQLIEIIDNNPTVSIYLPIIPVGIPKENMYHKENS